MCRESNVRAAFTSDDIDWNSWSHIANVESALATDHYLEGDPFPHFENHFEGWIDATGLWSGCLWDEHDHPVVLVCPTRHLWRVQDRWDEILYELERDAKARHPSLTAAERNR